LSSLFVGRWPNMGRERVAGKVCKAFAWPRSASTHRRRCRSIANHMAKHRIFCMPTQGTMVCTCQRLLVSWGLQLRNVFPILCFAGLAMRFGRSSARSVSAHHMNYYILCECQELARASLGVPSILWSSPLGLALALPLCFLSCSLAGFALGSAPGVCILATVVALTKRALASLGFALRVRALAWRTAFC
jgi:hypothetical protein